HEEAIRDTVISVLMSPYFMYRVDSMPDRTASSSDVRPLNDSELASRLSYFLWSSMPDDQLRAHAAAGDLHAPGVLIAQARRMLQDRRARDPGDAVARQRAHLRRLAEENGVGPRPLPALTQH